VARFDFPESPPLTAALREMHDNEEMAALWPQIARMHAVHPATLRVIWIEAPSGKERAIVEALWLAMHPRGHIEHIEEEGPYNGG
jgi:hypothetical protein